MPQFVLLVQTTVEAQGLVFHATKQLIFQDGEDIGRGEKDKCFKMKEEKEK